MKPAYYNEIEPYAVQWLKNLISAGLIADGDVDDRSIVDVRPDDLRGYRQCHFFSGIAVWSHALRIAGWPDDRPVWTGSCPCQPFSGAGKRAGFSDERHLWPAWFKLIEECRPPVVFGEQVSGAHALPWLDLVFNDLEGTGYACGAVDLPACGVGAPHIRQRHFWVADANDAKRRTEGSGRHYGDRTNPGRPQGSSDVEGCCVADGVADAHCERRDGIDTLLQSRGQDKAGNEVAGGRPVNGFWSAADWLWCRDGKHRPVEPGTRALAHRAPGRVGKLRAYGNAIVAPAAAEVIAAYMAVRP